MADIFNFDQAREQREDAARIKEREAFEAKLQQETWRRLNATVVNAIKTRTAYSESLHEAIVRNLLQRFTEDSGPLLTRFTEWRQQLPMNDESRVRRLVAFEWALHQYLPGVLREEFHRAGLEIDPSHSEHARADQAEVG